MRRLRNVVLTLLFCFVLVLVLPRYFHTTVRHKKIVEFCLTHDELDQPSIMRTNGITLVVQTLMKNILSALYKSKGILKKKTSCDGNLQSLQTNKYKDLNLLMKITLISFNLQLNRKLCSRDENFQIHKCLTLQGIIMRILTRCLAESITFYSAIPLSSLLFMNHIHIFWGKKISILI